MNPEPDPVESLFAIVLGKPAAERAAYLDQACAGDAALRQRIEALLKAHTEASGEAFLTSAYQPASIVDLSPEGPGTRIGPYKLLQQIGEGGMGVVYMAEQEQPVRRRVALKIIRPGMDSAHIIARFEAERQALAMMDHQNIARVLDAGTTPSGRPYFVMELVHGVPITRFCDDNKLTPRERLELFVPVCQAIQHAHQKGIIHRDVKPSNVLVTMYDDKPVPKVIDFGVAKAIEQRLTDKTLFTQFGTLVGTFEYMSPEQAEMNAFGVDTRSDVYSLGVLMYELLTGTTPLERERLRRAAFDEVVRLIKLEEAPRPSTRLSGSGNLAKIAAARKTDPGRLATLVRGELDWIALRCLEKNRSRRYESASALARDVERYLNDEQVEACPPSMGYRLKKFGRKNRGLLTTAGAFVALLLVAVGVSSWLAVEARSAKSEADLKREEAVEAGKVAIQAGERATQEWQRAENTLTQLKTSAAETRRALDRFTVTKGIQLAEEGNLLAALQWFIKPLERVGLTPEEEKIHRTRIACYLRHAPNRPVLRQMFLPSGLAHRVAWRSDGKRVLTVSDNIVQVWNISTGECIATLRHPESVSSAQFTADGRSILATVGPTLWTWDVQSGRQSRSPFVDWDMTLRPQPVLLPHAPFRLANDLIDHAFLTKDRGQVLSLSIDGRRMVFYREGLLRLWDVETTRFLGQLHCDGNWVLSPDGQRLLLLHDGAATAYNTTTGITDERRINHTSPVKSATFSADGTLASTIGRDGTVQIWDTIKWQAQIRIDNTNSVHYSDSKFSQDNRFIATWAAGEWGGGFRYFAWWDVKTGRLVHAITNQDHEPQVYTALDWRPDGQELLRYSNRGEITLYNPASPERLIRLIPHNRPLTAALYGPDASTLLTATDDGCVFIWDLDRQNERFLFKAVDDSLMQSIQVTYVMKNGTFSGSDPLSSPNVERMQQLLPAGTKFGHVAMSPDQSRILISVQSLNDGGKVKHLQLWDIKSKCKLRDIITTNATFNYATFSPDSLFVVTADSDGKIIIIDTRTGDSVANPIDHGASVFYMAFGPDSGLLVTCGGDHFARLWSVGSGQSIGERLRHEDIVTFAAFSADGQTVATASMDGSVAVWDSRGTALWQLKSKSSHALGLLFNGSGLLLVVSSNNTMRLWDIASQQEVSPAMNATAQLRGFTISVPGSTESASSSTVLNTGFDLPCDSRPIDDLVKLGQLYSGARLDTIRGTIPLHKDERYAVWCELRRRYPGEFSGSSQSAVAWRLKQLKSSLQSEQPAAIAFSRRWLAAELIESGWQPEERTNGALPLPDYIERLISIALHGHHVQAVAAADTLAARWQKDGQTLYKCAEVYDFAASAVKVDVALADRYATRATTLLRQAADTGYNDAQFILRLSDLAKARGHNAAVCSADAIAAHHPNDNETLYNCACIYGLASGAVKADAPLADRYGVRAVALLRQAADAGYKDSAHLQKDTDLDALRGREDFKALVKERFPLPK